jgi:phosphate transport system substrate-binding protein
MIWSQRAPKICLSHVVVGSLPAVVGMVLALGCTSSTPPKAPPLVTLEDDEPEAVTIANAGSNVTKVDAKLPKYQSESVEKVSGTIKSVGSDTMNNLMTLWAEGFRKYYPDVQTEVEGKGTSTAPPALIAGTANFGPMSRRMKASEIDQFQAEFGYKPIELETAVDALAVFVNKDNSLAGLTLPQVDAIFSSNRTLGLPDEIRTWDQLGLKGDFEQKPISLYGRNSASGTYGFFKENALGKGDFKDTVKEQPGSSAVVQAVSTDKFAIGYSGIGYITPGVRAVPLATDEGEPLVPATAEKAYAGEYPLSRTLNLAINYKPGSELDPLRKEFIKFIFSQEGQEVVIQDGYYPVTADMARKQLEAVGIDPGF